MCHCMCVLICAFCDFLIDKQLYGKTPVSGVNGFQSVSTLKATCTIVAVSRKLSRGSHLSPLNVGRLRRSPESDLDA